MASLSPQIILGKLLPGFDEELMGYISSMVEEMSIEEKRSHVQLNDVVGPFIIDTGYADEQGAMKICRDISIAFGGSGYKSNSATLADGDVDDAPILLSAPVKIINNAPILTNVKATYGGVVLADAADDSKAGGKTQIVSNSQLDIQSLPTTQKQLRRMRKENEQLQKILKAEASARAALAAELAAARMAAIKASRTAGKQSNMGVSIERLSLPHPSGTGDLLTDATLVLAPTHRYGLVGRNGAGEIIRCRVVTHNSKQLVSVWYFSVGKSQLVTIIFYDDTGKSTLLRCLANYKVDGLMHLRSVT